MDANSSSTGNVRIPINHTSPPTETLVGTRKRDIEHEIHRAPGNTVAEVDLCEEGTVYEFMDAVDSGAEPINCLDVPKVTGHAPEIIE